MLMLAAASVYTSSQGGEAAPVPLLGILALIVLGIMALIAFVAKQSEDPLFILYARLFPAHRDLWRHRLLLRLADERLEHKKLAAARNDASSRVFGSLGAAIIRHRNAFLENPNARAKDTENRLKEFEELLFFAKHIVHKSQTQTSDLASPWLDAQIRFLRGRQSNSRGLVSEKRSGDSAGKGNTIASKPWTLASVSRDVPYQISPGGTPAAPSTDHGRAADLRETLGLPGEKTSQNALVPSGTHSPQASTEQPKTTSVEPPEKAYHVNGTHIDWAQLRARCSEIGMNGELLVIEIEKTYLQDQGRHDLADRVKHVSKDCGDGAGYDILSFFLDGSPKYIEVKSTTKEDLLAFYLSRRELSFLKENRDTAFVYMVSTRDEQSTLTVLSSHDLDERCKLMPATFQAKRIIQ